MSPQNLDDIKKQAEFDRHITAARVHRMRGDYKQAEQAINQALELNPSDIGALEFAADMLFVRGELEKAADEYKRLFEQDKSRTSLEAKFAKSKLLIAEGKRQQHLLKEMLDNPAKYRVSARSPLLAAIISVAPGFGQIYCGQLVRGIVLFVATMLSWLLFQALTPEVADIRMQDRMTSFTRNMDPLAIIFACMAVAIHVYAFVDAAILAGKSRENKQTHSSEPQ